MAVASGFWPQKLPAACEEASREEKKRLFDEICRHFGVHAALLGEPGPASWYASACSVVGGQNPAPPQDE